MRSEAVESLAGEVGESLLAFTFDDGPSEWTTRIAKAFSARGGRATFFVIGDAVSGRENVLLSVDEQGHDIGNHSMTHRPLTGLDRASLMDELRGASERIQAVTGRWPLLLRPPYVLCDEAVLDGAGEMGM